MQQPAAEPASEVFILANALSPVTLPCSHRTVANKLVKVALYEHLSPMFGGPPNKLHLGLYKTWGRSNWGMILTGNVQVSGRHLTLGRDMVVPEELTEDTIRPFKMLASAMHGNLEQESEPELRSVQNLNSGAKQKPLALMQLSHGGRQSCNFIGGRRFNEPPLAPSAICVTSNKKGLLSDLLYGTLFQTPKEMSLEDIDDVVQRFVRGAMLAWKAGFDGVQLHVAHGYLLCEFLSPRTNQRDDQYSADKDNALRLIRRIVDEIKRTLPNDFVIGIKVNSADYVNSQATEDDVLSEMRITEHILSIAKWGTIDFIEISGGDYETPDFMAKSRRQAFFSQFSHHIVEVLDSLVPRPLVVLTGGLRTPSLLCNVLSARHADLLGIGRGSLLRPDLPLYLQELMDTSKAIDDPTIWEATFEREPELGTKGISGWIWDKFPRVPLIGAGVQMTWYGVMMRRLGEANALLPAARVLTPDYKLGAFMSVMKMWFWSLGSRKYSVE
ncbi:hypothetical protein APHAL10511_006796 [Amanita phalloides]|nr:hypothetical protein APHAL10511_006796 [Amanita phalloides]